MAFKKSGSHKDSKIEVIKPITNSITKLQASESIIKCPKCKQIIGKKLGNVYQILDKQYVSMNGIVCPKCGR